jgi:hypothetical protein
MITLLNYWHYIAFGVISIIAVASIALIMMQNDKKIVPTAIFLVFLFSFIFAGLSIVIVDSSTKKVALYKFKDKRNYFTESVIFSGIIKNEGEHEIGEVVLEITMSNQGGSDSGSYFVPEGFKFKPQEVVEEFIVATNLKPSESRDFTVRMRYPAHFKDSVNFTKITAH